MASSSTGEAVECFADPTRDWMGRSFAAPTPVQTRGWPVIASGRHALLVAPTGSGKTLAAFLWAIDSLGRLPPEAPPGVRVVYVSPLKALAYDVERNLRVPLVGIERAAQRLGRGLRRIGVDVRTGDTPAEARRRQVRHPADILVTTPESLFLLLGSQARETLREVHTIIVDEVHALLPTKRGVHLALSLERLSALNARDPQRVGLSATVRPLDEAARFLGGDRPVAVVDAGAPPRLDLQVVVPVPDMERVPPPRRGGPILAEPPDTERGIWAAIYPALLAEIRACRSTIVFVSSRGLCERLCQRLNALAEEPLSRAHHGSVSQEQRREIEEALKRGELPAIIATGSLELGIDMGAVDRVVLLESPGSVARGLQRVGRAGHQVEAVSVGRIYPKFRGDLLECAVVAGRMLEGAIEALAVPRNVLDVLAQQLVAMCCDAPREVAELGRLCRRAYPYQALSEGGLLAVLEMLSGGYPGTELAELQPRLVWDRSQDRLSARRGAALVMRANAGTIPDRGSYAVHLGADGPRVGELDEEMVFETRVGENVLLGASTWRVEEVTRDRVIVSPAPGEPGKLPFWHGDGPGRPVELGRAVGALVRRVGSLGREQGVADLQRHLPLGRYAAENLVAYIHEQRQHTGTLPTDQAITVERFRDELGDWRVCLLSPFGARVHAPWALAVQAQLAHQSEVPVRVMYTDDGLVLRFADVEEPPALDCLVPDPNQVEDLVTAQLAGSALYAGLFRENAARALLLPRRRAGARTPLWAQRLRSQTLLATVQRYPRFPIVLETYRQALNDVFDLPGLKALLAAIGRRELRVVEVETPAASPFARSLVFAYVAAYMYAQDAPLAERRAQALTLDRRLLAELLGQAELRELIDPQALAELEAELQHLAPERRASDADALHDLLRRLGDLSIAELERRAVEDPGPWLRRLAAERRAAAVTIAGEQRWIAAADAGLYRDGLGVVPPLGLPDAFLAAVDDPMPQLLRRYARSHGPFLSRELAARYARPAGALEPALANLAAAGHLLRGELRPGGAEPEWCDPEVLRRLKRRTLARLRHQAAPVDGSALGSFLPAWHGIGAMVREPRRLREAILQLEGLPLPWSSLSRVLLPARVPGFAIEQLDALAAGGEVVWVGESALGARDGRIMLLRRDLAARILVPAATEPPADPVHAAILYHLDSRGASFLVMLEDGVRRAVPGASRVEFEAALWDLVWAGQITNDTFGPLRSLGAGRARAAQGRRPSGPGLAGGRWFLVRELHDPAVADTERALARAQMLLERYGIVSREAAQAEALAGGFGPVYRVLRAMEEAGKVRRGYFVEGLSGAQFAHAGTVDRLRASRPEAPPGSTPQAVALSALDPANPYGSLLPWPATGAGDALKPRRLPGSWVILVGGRPMLYLGAGGRQLASFPAMLEDDAESRLDSAFTALARLPRGGRRGALVVEQLDGQPVRESAHYRRMSECGFESDYRGLTPAPQRIASMGDRRA